MTLITTLNKLFKKNANDGNKAALKSFEPLLKKSINKKGTFICQSMSTINNIHIHSSYYAEEKHAYHKTNDIPIIEQPNLSNSKFENNNFNKTPK